MRFRLFTIAGFFVFGLTCAVLNHASAVAQATAQIAGTVVDQTGSAVPGVELTATQTETGFKKAVTTDETGSYLLTQLPVGPYRLEAAKSGFRNYSQTGIVLLVNSNPVIPVTMIVGQVSESVEVQANASAVETRNMGVGSVVENQRILELPLNGRNTTELITLAGAAVSTNTSPAWAMKTGTNISVAGGLTSGVAYSLDGAQHSNFYDATGMPLPFPDALQEFKLETSSLSAQNGTHSGATVNGVTKSGTNSLHGDLFEFIRNGNLNARNFFAAARDSIKRNQFGGTVGGPIKKDRIFFFGGYQGTSLRQDPSDATGFVPTAKMLQGDFTTFASATCQGTQRNLSGGFVGNMIDARNFSPAALRVAARLPQTSDPCGKVLFGLPVHENDHQFVARIDYQLNEKQTLFGRYLATKLYNAVPYSLTNNLLATATPAGSPVFSYGQDDLATSFTLGHTYLMSTNAVNSFRASLNRVSANHPGPSFFGPSEIGVNAYSYLPHYMGITVTGGPAIGQGTAADLFVKITMLQLNDDVSLVRGAHQFGFGGSVGTSLVDGLANVFSIGGYTFTGQVTGLGMADFLLGRVSTFQQAAPNGLILYQRFFNLYAQDTWKLNTRLTLNYGVRWEPFFPMNMKDNKIFNFSLDRYNRGVTSTVYPNAPAGFLYPGDAGFNGQSSIEKQWADFSPRVGFAWDPKGDGRTSIRGGVGISYDFVNEQLHHNTTTANPFGGRTVLTTGVLFDDPWRNVKGGNIFPYVSSPGNGLFAPFGTFQPIPSDLRTPRVYAWNLSAQRQVSQALFISASYVGNHAIHMLTSVELNAPQLIPGAPALSSNTDPRCAALTANCQSNENQRRLLYQANPTKAQNIGFLTQYDDGATQAYNGLLLNTTWKPRNTVNISANYTWSHCIGDQTIGNIVPNPGQNYIHQGNRSLDRGNCLQDRRQIFNLTGVAQSPRFSNKTARWLASGWTYSTIYRIQTGQPLLILAGIDAALTGFTTAVQRGNQLLADVYATSPATKNGVGIQFLNPAAFGNPALGTLGNVGAYNLIGPGYWKLDMALSREFRVREGQRFEVRGEAFNVVNALRAKQIFANSGGSGFTTLSSGNLFGAILSAEDPRILQFAAKFVF